jgi:PAS domain S-box-containing protein
MILDKLSRAVDQSAQGVLITNRDGVIEYVNAAFEAIAGFSRSDLIGRTPSVLRSGVQKPRFYDTLWSTILAGHTFHAVVTNRRRDGRLFDYEETITPIRNDAGVITHFMSTGRDVTDSRRGEAGRLYQQLEQAARQLAEVHADTGQFLALAHMTLADVAQDVDASIAARLREVRHYLDQVEERLRRATRDSHPAIVSDLGLVDAVRFLADGWTRRGGVEVTVESSLTSSCPAAVEALLYEFVQDALAVLIRHTASRNVTVSLTRQVGGRRTGDETVSCIICGDSTAPDPPELMAAPENSVGLDAIRQRVAAVGGVFDITALPGEITEIHAVVPLQA